ncbi:XdhC family protein [Pseudomonas abietaniphila]|uniref:XdhC family protein n=1 Tax=Pseudomonas abietaniphila TaxID=89065 RepID=UPI0032177CB5
MSDITAVLDAIRQHHRRDNEMVLATVVKTLGSSYRRPGARMIIPAVGTAVGMVSGGCLETDLVKKAWWRTSNGATLLVYDTNEDGDTIDGIASEGFGTGCHGQITLLLERAGDPGAALLIDVLDRVVRARKPAAVATIVSGNAGVGDRLALDVDHNVVGALADPDLQILVEQHLLKALTARKSSFHSVPLKRSTVSFFLEYIQPPQRLVIFGAGNDVPPLVQIAKMWGWHVSVIDSRSHFAKASRFPDADVVLHAPLNEPFDFTEQVTGAAVAVMTHSLTQDQHWLAHCLREDTAYIGQLGPIERTERLLKAMAPVERAAANTRLHYPIGLDIGGDSAPFVAVSILAEANAALEKRSACSSSVKRRMTADAGFRASG